MLDALSTEFNQCRYMKLPFDVLAYVLSEKSKGSANHEICERIWNIASSASFIKIDQCFVDQAETIRKYYRNKLCMLQLKGKKLSKFRICLLELVEDPFNIDIEHLGILVRLDDFYKEDQVIEGLARSNLITDAAAYENSLYHNTILDLEYVTKLYRKTQKDDSLYYFFKDQNRQLFCGSLSPRNPCINLLEGVLSQDNVKIELSGSGTQVRGTDIGYILLHTWKII